jgi:hypothetical protein
MLSVAGFGQSHTRTEEAAIWLRDQLNTELQQRIPSATKHPLADYPFHFVFLVDASQASSKSAYPEFVKQTLSHFLRAVENAQKDRGSYSTVSIVPYDTALHLGSGLDELTLTPDNIRKAIALVPTVSLGPGPGGKGGHDHSGTRKELLTLLTKNNPGTPPSTWTKPVLLVQFTTIDVNEVPGEPDRDRQVRPLSARNSMLEGSGFEAYNVTGLPLKTDPPKQGLEPFNVYIWTYGPAEFSGVKALNPIDTAPATQPVSNTKSPVGEIIGWIVAVAVIGGLAYVLYKMMNPVRRVTVQRGNTGIYGRDLRRNERVEIWGPGAKDAGISALVLPADAAPGIPAQKLASMRLVGNQIVIEPQVYDVLTPGRQGGGSLTVNGGDRKGFQLTKDHLKTQMLYVTLSK